MQRSLVQSVRERVQSNRRDRLKESNAKNARKRKRKRKNEPECRVIVSGMKRVITLPCVDEVADDCHSDSIQPNQSGRLRTSVTFGKAVRLSGVGYNVPYHQDDADVRSDVLAVVISQLRENSLLALVMYTLLRRCFDTSSGKVGLFFATLYNSADEYPVAVGHWSLLRTICGHYYSRFNPRTKGGVRKDDLVNALSGIYCPDICAPDLIQLRAVSGADRTHESRVLKHSHFVISAYWIKYAAMALSDVSSIEQLLHDSDDSGSQRFCTDRRITVEGLGEYEHFAVSSYKLTRCPQSKTSAAAHFGDVRSTEGTDNTTPSFGVQWSNEQLDLLATAMKLFNDTGSVAHYTDFYTADRVAPMRERDDIIEGMPNGVFDDRHARPTTKNNYAFRRTRDKVTDIMRIHGLTPRGRGRPSMSMRQTSKLQDVITRNLNAARGKRGSTENDVVDISDLVADAQMEATKIRKMNTYVASVGMSVLDNI